MAAKEKKNHVFEEPSNFNTTDNEFDISALTRIILLIDPMCDLKQMNLQKLIKNIREQDGVTLDKYFEEVYEFLDKQLKDRRKLK
ncbi:hypothetical protein [Sphingobacterium siyangense]|uniref:hypothetical protein n=1 Tax=Sphingobacterium siyangense TaxID=459529 RepID=UPI003DA51CA2